MFDKAAKLSVSSRFRRKVTAFRTDEGGAIAIFVLMIFVMMLLVGGIAVDVMRAEMRRVTYQQTFDRAVLAAANVSLPPDQTPITVGQSWYNVAGLDDEFMVDYGTPTFTGTSTASSREAKAVGQVRSYNHFMHMLDVPYFTMPVKSAAQQGVSKIEVMMALDITGSMNEASGSTTKIAALKQAASNFLTILKYSKDAGGNYTVPKDPNNLISIGMVPYSSSVNIPANLRSQFTVSHLSSWDGMANQGVPKTNCFEIPESTYGTMALSRTSAIPMQAVAHTQGSAPGVGTITLPGATNTNGANGGIVNLGYTAAVEPQINNGSYTCHHGDNPSTGADEWASNLLAMPTTNIAALKTQINSFRPRGTTSIAAGMRWATALIDESARPIYDNIVPEPAMAGRPAANNDNDTRKIIVLMTDGTHVSSKFVRDAYKSGPSPIWRGTDGRMAIEFNDSGIGLTGGTRPGINPTGTTPPGPVNSCSGWSLANRVVDGVTVKRNFFVPHLKANAVRRTTDPNRPEGNGNTGGDVAGACDPRAWIAPTGGAPQWPGSGVVRRLDWSEVWRYATVDWVIEQLFMRSNVTGATNYNTVYNTMVGDWMNGTANMDALLAQNCTAAKNAGVEIFGIVLGDDVTPGPIQNCSSPGTGYFYWVKNADDLNAAFEQIAVLISELRLTQ
ncbi:TadE/TadG family type IV pilus assembly protein [Tabrizicola flagellatus]|uniref:TadE/TadG family type IV pilus assembly protein n=1 Tax=Tabrizicola flagellatus TaxID=2593021 RepID=UPI0013592E2D|nr:Tad domain-containing protein [Tabrizicola flagellatus]